MKREAYERIFLEVPITDFFVKTALRWCSEDDVNEATKKKVRRVIKYIIDNNMAYTDSEIFSSPLCDGRNLRNAVMKYGGNCEFISRVTNNPNYTEEHAKMLFKVCLTEHPYLFDTGDDPRMMRHMLLKGEYTPEAVLRVLAKSKFIQVRTDVASSLACPADLLEELSNDKALAVRNAVAGNRHTPEYILLKLVDDKNPQVRHAVAYNRAKTERVIRALAKYEDDYWTIRGFIRDPKCPADVLEIFANYTHNKPDFTLVIRSGVATNPNLSKAGWDTLYSDPNHSWRNLALASKLCPVQFIGMFDEKVKFAKDAVYYILKRDDITEEVIDFLLHSKGAKITAAVIQDYDKIPQETLLEFCSSKSYKIRDAVSKRSIDGDDVIMQMLKETDVNNENRLEYCFWLIDSLGSGSADMFIDFINGQHEMKFKSHFIRSYLSNSKCSNSDLWKVFDEYAEESFAGYKNYAEAMLEAITRRSDPSDELLEEIVNCAMFDVQINDGKYTLARLCGKNFFTKTMLNMCIEFIKQEKQGKKNN